MVYLALVKIFENMLPLKRFGWSHIIAIANQ